MQDVFVGYIRSRFFWEDHSHFIMILRSKLNTERNNWICYFNHLGFNYQCGPDLTLFPHEFCKNEFYLSLPHLKKLRNGKIMRKYPKITIRKKNALKPSDTSTHRKV